MAINLNHIDNSILIGTSEKIRITSGGQVSIRSSATAFDGTGVLDALQLHYETDSGKTTVASYSSGGSTYLSFATNAGGAAATEKLRIRSDGKVVIGSNYSGGTLSVTGNLITDDGTNGRITIQADGTSTNQILSTTTGFGSYCNIKYQAADHIFLYGGTERFRLKNDGRMGINATPSVANEYLHIKPVGNNVLDLRYDLNSDTDIRH